MPYNHILIIADIEGSSACLDRVSAKFMGKGWPGACLGMSRDVNSVVTALFNRGVPHVSVQDFHRTAYNIIPGLLHPRANLIQGYRRGPVPGMGTPVQADGMMMLGMHAPSGSSGFLSHTLTSRIARIMVNNSLVSEAQLFSAALAPYGIPPLFFSGCTVACDHTAKTIPGVHCFPIPKKGKKASPEEVRRWRKQLAQEAVQALSFGREHPYNPPGPFHAVVTMTHRKAARQIANQWGYGRKGAELHLNAPNLLILFQDLVRLAFLTPLGQRLIPLGLPLYHLMGRAGMAWVQKQPLSQTGKGADNIR